MNEIICADCGAERQARNKNTKYCRVCRLSRNLVYLRKRQTTSTCVLCDTKFAPLQVGDDLCAKCDYQPESAPVVVCALCNESRRSIDNDIAVCLECAKDPEKRDVFLRALKKKINARLEARS